MSSAQQPQLLRRKSSNDISEKSNASKDGINPAPVVELIDKNDLIFMVTIATFQISTIDYSASISTD